MSGRIPNEQYAFNQRQSEAYRGYLITPAGLLSWDSAHQFTISKDKFHICYASSVDDAKQKIDQIAE